jgi:predicted HTH domain antitoxin
VKQEVREHNIYLERRVREISHHLEIAVSERKKVVEENRCLVEENENYCERISKLQDDMRTLRLEISSLKITIEALRKERISLTTKIEILDQEIRVHQKELSIVIVQLETCQGNLSESQRMWFLAVQAQHELEMAIRAKMELLVKIEYERDGLDAKVKLLERKLELSTRRVDVHRETTVEWEARFSLKATEVKKLLEMWAGMDKVCKVSVHGKEHWKLHKGFPKGLTVYGVDCEDTKTVSYGHGHDHSHGHEHVHVHSTTDHGAGKEKPAKDGYGTPPPPKKPGYDAAPAPKTPGYGHDHAHEHPKTGSYGGDALPPVTKPAKDGYGTAPPPKKPSHDASPPPKTPGYGHGHTHEHPKTGPAYPPTPETPGTKPISEGGDKKKDHLPAAPVPEVKKPADPPKKDHVGKK